MDKIPHFDKSSFGKQCIECFAFFEYQKGICPSCGRDYEAHKYTENIKSLSFSQITNQTEAALTALVKFVHKKANNYHYYGFRDAFNIIFQEARKPENKTMINCERILNCYHALTSIECDFINGYYDSIEDKKHAGFYQDCEEISSISGREEDFHEFGLPVESGFYNPISISGNEALLTPYEQPLELADIALIHYYSCGFGFVEEITNGNSNRIAAIYGQTSGEKLMKHVRSANHDPVWRYGVNKEFKQESSNRRKRLKKVVNYLKTKKYIKAHNNALAEYNKLNTEYNKVFSKVPDI